MQECINFNLTQYPCEYVILSMFLTKSMTDMVIEIISVRTWSLRYFLTLKKKKVSERRMKVMMMNGEINQLNISKIR